MAPRKIPKITDYPINTLVRITASGGQSGDWWQRVALTGGSQVLGSYHHTMITVVHPDTEELSQQPWRTEWLEVLPQGEELEEVEALQQAIARVKSEYSDSATEQSFGNESDVPDESNSKEQLEPPTEDELPPQSEQSESDPVVALVEVVEEPSFDSASSRAKVQVPIGTCENFPVVENELLGSELPLAVDVLPPVMTEVEALQCLQEIKGLFDVARAKLLQFKEGRGWEALKYPHLTACLEDYFPESRTSLVRELFAAEVERDILQVPIGTCPASHFRPLRKLSPSQYKSALDKAYEFAGNGKLKSTHVTKAVDEIFNSNREAERTEAPPYKPSELVRIYCRAGALPEQKAWNGCWAIVHSTGNISCVRVLVGGKEIAYMAGDLDWDENSDAQFRHICERILALWQTELEPTLADCTKRTSAPSLFH